MADTESGEPTPILRGIERVAARSGVFTRRPEMPFELRLAIDAWTNACMHWEVSGSRIPHVVAREQELDRLADEISALMNKIEDMFVRSL